MMKHIKNLLGVLALTLLLPLSAFADRLPGYYPDEFRLSGTIDRIDTREGEIVIDDSLMLLAPNARIHTLRSKLGSSRDLKNGNKIGFTLIKTDNNKKSVTEIWVLPDDY